MSLIWRCLRASSEEQRSDRQKLKELPGKAERKSSSGFYFVSLYAINNKQSGNQAGVLQFGHKDRINYSKIGTGKSGLGNLKSELNSKFKFEVGVLAFARKDEYNTEDSEFFIILKDINLYQGEYTPLGKVLYGIDVLKKIKIGNKSEYVLRPDYIFSLKMYK